MTVLNDESISEILTLKFHIYILPVKSRRARFAPTPNYLFTTFTTTKDNAKVTKRVCMRVCLRAHVGPAHAFAKLFAEIALLVASHRG